MNTFVPQVFSESSRSDSNEDWALKDQDVLGWGILESVDGAQ